MNNDMMMSAAASLATSVLVLKLPVTDMRTIVYAVGGAALPTVMSTLMPLAALTYFPPGGFQLPVASAVLTYATYQMVGSRM